MDQGLTDEFAKELRLAIVQEDAKRVQEMIADVDVKALGEYRFSNGRGDTFLIEAVRIGNEKAIDLLLEKGVNPNVTGRQERKALGAYFNYDDIAKVNRINQKLLNAGAIDETGEFTKSEFLQAIEAQDLKKVQEFIDAGLDVNQENKEGKPLWNKVTGNPQMFQTLVNAGMDLEFPSDLGHTALLGALYLNKNDIAQICIDAKANVNAKATGDGCEDYTSLHFARNLEIVKQLIAAKVDVNAVAKDGEVPIFNSDSVEITKALYDAGANIHVCVNNMNLMTRNANMQNIDMLKYLQSIGLDINEPDQTGWRPLQYAIAKNSEVQGHSCEAQTEKIIFKKVKPNPEIVQQMIDMGAKVTPEMIEGCSNDEIRIVLEKALAQQGTSLNNEDKKNAWSSEEKKATAAVLRVSETFARVKPNEPVPIDMKSQGLLEERLEQRNKDKTKTSKSPVQKNEVSHLR